jgi:hypothetical protein
MSREVLATLPDAGTPGRPSTQRPNTRSPSTQRPSTRRPNTQSPNAQSPSTRRPNGYPAAGHAPAQGAAAPHGNTRRRLLALALAAVLGLGAGWAGDGIWRSTQSAEARLRAAGLAVAVTDARRTADTATRLSADLTVQLTNLGLVPVQLIGSELAHGAAAVVSIDPPRVTVPVGDTRTAVLRVDVGCRSPQPLDLPPLQVRTPDGGLMSVAADGSGQVLADLCEAGPEVDHLVRQVGVSRDGAQLKVAVVASSRTTELHSIRAGDVPLQGRPLPTTVNGVTRTIWLEPPTGCPLAWQRNGLPESLELDVGVGTGATVRIPVGYALAEWLLDGPCRGSAR